MHPMLNTAVKAARKAGAVINRAASDIERLTVHAKKPHDYVSEVDHLAEQMIIETLLEAYPGHGILAEETGRTGGEEYVWIIDPLDGTTNFLHAVPQYAVSIALLHKGALQHSVVFDPAHNELFTATRGGGAFLNERRIRVSKQHKMDDALIGTGFPYHDFRHVDAYLGMLKDMMQKTAGLRRPGSAALDLAWVACGRYDGFFELALNPWDIAGGALLVLEAGGLVGDFEGNDKFLESGHIVAANPKIFGQMLPVFAPHLTAEIRATK